MQVLVAANPSLQLRCALSLRQNASAGWLLLTDALEEHARLLVADAAQHGALDPPLATVQAATAACCPLHCEAPVEHDEKM
jgi:hypothetical protein